MSVNGDVLQSPVLLLIFSNSSNGGCYRFNCVSPKDKFKSLTPNTCEWDLFENRLDADVTRASPKSAGLLSLQKKNMTQGSLIYVKKTVMLHINLENVL